MLARLPCLTFNAGIPALAVRQESGRWKKQLAVQTSIKRNTAMAAERAQNLQDTFLNHVRKSKIPLTIFLVNGVKLQGVVTWFDNFCVLLRRDGHSQLVYKHAISTIMPGHPIQLFEGAEEAPTGDKD
jgi:host factor-I protein